MTPSTFQLPTYLVESSNLAKDRQADVVRFDEALERNAAELDAAKASHNEALNLRTALDTELALATDEAASKALETKVKRANDNVNAAQSLIDRRERVRKALVAEREKALEALKIETSALAAEIVSFLPELRDFVSREIGAALGPLEAALRRAWALDAAVRPGTLSGTLSDIVIPIPGPGYEHFIRGDRVVSEGKIGTLRYDMATATPTLTELYLVAHAPTELLRRLNAYISEAHLTPAQRAEQAASRVRAAKQLEDARREDAAAKAALAARRAAPATARGYTPGELTTEGNRQRQQS